MSDEIIQQIPHVVTLRPPPWHGITPSMFNIPHCKMPHTPTHSVSYAPPCPPWHHSQFNYQYKDTLVGALIIAGYDKQGGGQVYGCPIGGTLSKEAWAIDGSGSTYIWGYCDAEFRWV